MGLIRNPLYSIAA